MKLKNILLTNDDGYSSIGLKIVEDYFKSIGLQPKTVAPLAQRSGASSAITIYGKLKVTKISEDVLAVDGTPVDCVKFALKQEYVKGLPDLVVSGINKGDNAGQSVFYSGTIGAAFEGAMQGVNSVALSLFTDCLPEIDFNEGALGSMLKDFFENYYHGGFVTVNFPYCDYTDFNGFKVVPVSTSTFVEKYTEIEPGLFEIGLDTYYEGENSETILLKGNWATISPMRIDLTDFDKLG